MITQIFVNLPVRDLDKSMAFFAKLGFTFNPQFTDEKAACMLIGENIYAMLLSEEFFRTFTRKEIIDARKSTEVILALAADKKERVDELAKLAIEAGGTTPSEPQDLGFMYSRNFQDLDGHLWEVLYMEQGASSE
jgi:predicted lactoylglutathione lyase